MHVSHELLGESDQKVVRGKLGAWSGVWLFRLPGTSGLMSTAHLVCTHACLLTGKCSMEDTALGTVAEEPEQQAQVGIEQSLPAGI